MTLINERIRSPFVIQRTCVMHLDANQRRQNLVRDKQQVTRVGIWHRRRHTSLIRRRIITNKPYVVFTSILLMPATRGRAEAYNQRAGVRRISVAIWRQTLIWKILLS